MEIRKVAEGAFFVPSWSDQTVAYKFDPTTRTQAVGIPILSDEPDDVSYADTDGEEGDQTEDGANQTTPLPSRLVQRPPAT